MKKLKEIVYTAKNENIITGEYVIYVTVQGPLRVIWAEKTQDGHTIENKELGFINLNDIIDSDKKVYLGLFTTTDYGEENYEEQGRGRYYYSDSDSDDDDSHGYISAF